MRPGAWLSHQQISARSVVPCLLAISAMEPLSDLISPQVNKSITCAMPKGTFWRSNGASLARADFLYWTAGFNDETDGGFGSLNYIGTPNPDPSAAAAGRSERDT